MRTVLRCVVLLWCCVLLAVATPWRDFVAHNNQACGDKLANIMSIVCDDRGYNMAFRPEPTSARRMRRGIVEECCHRSCSPALLELYCRADPTELEKRPSNVQIRKRSDSGVDSTELHQVGDVTKQSTPESETQNTFTKEIKGATKATTAKKEGEENYKLLNLLVRSEQTTYKENTRTSVSKETPNDTTQEEFHKQSNIPPLRHHKHHHHSMRLRERKDKAKRGKKSSGESKQTFQIGTVKPYFVGKALASVRSNYVHHGSRSLS